MYRSIRAVEFVTSLASYCAVSRNRELEKKIAWLVDSHQLKDQAVDRPSSQGSAASVTFTASTDSSGFELYENSSFLVMAAPLVDSRAPVDCPIPESIILGFVDLDYS